MLPFPDCRCHPGQTTTVSITPAPAPKFTISQQLCQLISLGRACAVLPESFRNQLGEDLAAVPVLDAHTVTTVIAWQPHSRSRVVAALVDVATRALRG